MVRKKNVGDTVMTSFAVTCLVSILWLICTYSLAFPSRNSFHRRAGPRLPARHRQRHRQGHRQPNPLAPTIPETVYICFQLTFAIITPALIAGAFAERMKFSAMLWFIGLWAIFVYAPVAHWVWGPDGFLNAANADGMIKVLDFAGGTVVHINSGVAGLMACILLGKRKETGPGHNMVLTFIGASLLWVGWFGFNAGSAVSAGMVAGMAMLVTHMATAVAAFTWMIVEWMVRGKPTVIGICTGAVAGLVAITPASGFVGPIGAVCIGVRRRHRLLLGLHRPETHAGLRRRARRLRRARRRRHRGRPADRRVRGRAYGGQPGLFDGNPMQVLNQLYGILIVFVYDAIVSLIILKIVDIFIGLRVSDEVEREGLDLALHGETVH
jgi:Amt family ammonium transporter